MSEKLKPCPFCGSRAVVCCTADYGYIVRCDGDDCPCCCPTTWYCNTEEQAIETWNRRAGDNESERKQDDSERECENCKHYDVSLFNEPCASCSMLRHLDKWERR